MRILIAIILFSFTCQGQVVKASKNYIPFAVTSCTPDADAQAYIDSAGITNQSEKDAVCNFVTQLKNYSLWDKIIAAYPLAGTTSTSQKWNLKDPRDLDAAYRITWSGTLTHNSSGVKPSSGGKGSTHIAYNSVDIDSVSIAAYITENLYSNFSAVGIAPNISELYAFSGSVVYFWRHGANIVSTNGATGSSDARGFYLGNSTSAGTSAWFNGVVKSSQSTVATSVSDTTPYTINAASSFTGTIGFVWIGWGLTNAQVLTLNNILETYMDAVGRGYQ